MKKFKRAVTDSEARVCVGEGKEGINNLIGILSAVTGKTAEEITLEFEGRGYGDFKTAVGESVVAVLEPIQKRYSELLSDRKYLEELAQKGAESAGKLAKRTIDKVYKKVGLVR